MSFSTTLRGICAQAGAPGRLGDRLGTRQHAGLVEERANGVGLRREHYGTHSRCGGPGPPGSTSRRNLLSALERRGVFDDLAVIFTSDHGDCLNHHRHGQK